jgi:hypothetical protein
LLLAYTYIPNIDIIKYFVEDCKMNVNTENDDDDNCLSLVKEIQIRM